jgi:signal transduction histidine kinase
MREAPLIEKGPTRAEAEAPTLVGRITPRLPSNLRCHPVDGACREPDASGRLRGVWARASPRWRSLWLALPVWLRVPWVFVGLTALMGMVLLGGGMLDGSVRQAFAAGEAVVVPLGAGLLLLLVGRRLEGPSRRAWMTIGAGVTLRGVGEVVWQFYFIAGIDLPYPNVADGFCLAAYPVILLGVLLLPHLRPHRWERVRLTLDAIAGSVATLAIAWTSVPKDFLHPDPDVGFLGNLTNLAYPVGDLILLIAILILSTRRSAYRFDGRLLALGVGLLVLTTADVTYILQLGSGTIDEVGPLVGLYYGAAGGALVLSALLTARPVQARDLADRPSHLWSLVVPYTPVFALFALTVGQIGNQGVVLVSASAFVATLVMTRQTVAIRETRDVVEKERDDLVTSVSHELRTPLTVVAGFVDVLQESPDLDRDERVEIVDIVASQTHHLSHIVGDLVQVARGTLHAVDLIPEDLAISDLVASAINMLSNRAAAAAITTHIQPGLTVRADPSRLRQALLIYLMNAASYSRGIVEVLATTTPGGVLIEVHDNGPGVPKKYQLSIWDRFQRGAQTYLSQVQGSGLGLAIARGLIAAHLGNTGCRRSERLGGACFWLTIPASTSSHPASSPTTNAEPATDAPHSSSHGHDRPAHPPGTTGRPEGSLPIPSGLPDPSTPSFTG